MILSPSTCAQFVSVNARGSVTRKTSSRISVDGINKLWFKTGGSGSYSRTIQAPAGPSRSVPVVLEQFVSGAWVSADMATLLLVATGDGGGSTPPPPPPPAPTPPTQVTGLTATAGNTVVNLAWQMPGNGGSPITGFKVRRGGTVIATLGPVLTYQDTGRTNGTSYSYTVAAINAVDEGAQSASVSATPTAPPPPPNPPSIVQILTGSVGDRIVALSWGAPASNGGYPITSYRVKQGGALIATVTGTSRTVTGLTNGTTYTFAVSAVNSAGLEGPAASILLTPVAPPVTPTPSSPIVLTSPTTISDLSFSGPIPTATGGSPPPNLGIGIYANGPLGSPINAIVLRRCTFSGFSWAINLSNVTNYIVEDCVIADADYAGIAIYSGVHGQILRNTTERIGYVRDNFTDPTFDNNAYGITLDRLGQGYTAGYPLSSDALIAANVVRNVPLWQGINTHGGRDMLIDQNDVYLCARAIFITATSAASNPSLRAANLAANVRVTRNRLLQALSKAGGTSTVAVTLAALQGGAVIDNDCSTTYGVPSILDYLAESTGVDTTSIPNRLVA